jgi:hypothetical protein
MTIGEPPDLRQHGEKPGGSRLGSRTRSGFLAVQFDKLVRTSKQAKQ